MIKREYPILEFDNKPGKIDPVKVIKRLDVPEHCIITFFREPIANLLEENRLREVGTFKTATINIPIYVTQVNGKEIGIIQGYLGSAGSGAQLEELIAIGFSKFIVTGAAGVLRSDIQVGNLVVPTSAVRDEGLSYHYLEPSREVKANEYAVKTITEYMKANNIPFIEGKTWTTDAFYRETEEKIALRISEDCITVEMEAAAFFAVAQFRNVILGQILHGGDDLTGVEWDSRSWTSRKDLRMNLVDLSMEICLEL